MVQVVFKVNKTEYLVYINGWSNHWRLPKRSSSRSSDGVEVPVPPPWKCRDCGIGSCIWDPGAVGYARGVVPGVESICAKLGVALCDTSWEVIWCNGGNAVWGGGALSSSPFSSPALLNWWKLFWLGVLSASKLTPTVSFRVETVFNNRRHAV